MRSTNVEGFVSTVPTLYEEEEDYAPLCGYRHMRSSIITFFFLFFFFFVQRWHRTDKAAYIWTAHALLQYATTTQDRENQNGWN